MSRRKSIYIEGITHKNPIPAASRIGPWLVSSGITGKNPATGDLPADLESQCANMFELVRRVLEAAGGSPDDILKVEVRMQDPAQRGTVNVHWLKMFPDPASRPARHTTRAQLDGGQLVQCDFIAVLPE
jgi:enamine deaminase RidA (YjgF/YER057c/UK114 family)